MTFSFDIPEHLVASPRLSGFSTHPSGGVIALRKELSADGKKYVTRAWSVERIVDRAVGRQLTHDQHGVSEVCPAADGNVFFTSGRPYEDDDKERTRLWLLPPHGEARMILERPGDVEDLKLGGDRLFFVSGTLPSARHAKDVKVENEKLNKLRENSGVSAVLYEKAPTRGWDHDLGPDEPTLWFVSASNAIDGVAVHDQARHVRLPEGRLLGYEPSHDGSFVMVTVKTWIEGGWERSEVWRVPATEDGSGEPELIRAADPDIWWETGPVSPDGKRVILLKERLWRSTQNLSISLWVYDFASGDEHEILPGDEYWGEDPRWINDSTVVCSADYRGRGIVLRVSCAPGKKTTVETSAGGDGQGWTYGSVQVAGDQLWAVRSRVDRPEELVRWPAEEFSTDPDPVEGLLPDGVPAGRLEEVTTTAEDGTEIRAWLALPDTPAAEELPLLVFVHGGPWASNNAWLWRWNPWPFVARGYAVLLPDPAISTGYGQHMIDR
ncbi:MAG: S9 family peptidase, partial [Kocuria sp.]|nr:S9 family peptidase [Kocuria sp.]